MGRLWLALSFAAGLAACTSSPKPGGDMGGGGAGGGGGSSGADLAGGPADLAPRSIAGIACGTDTCTATAQLCCTGDNGYTGVCQMTSNPSCGTSEFLCDGPEDCEPADPDCCVQGGFAACRPAGFCAMQAGAKLMCHVKNDACPAPSKCVAAPKSPYALCL